MMPSQLVPPRRSSKRSSRRSLPRRPLQSATFQRTEDADQNTETLSAHLDIVQNGGGAVPQLYTRALTKPNMMPDQLVPPRRPLRRLLPRRLSRRPPRRLSSQRSRSLLKRRLPRRLSRRPLQSVTFQRTEDADQNTETLS